jgi:hypothetical protein
MKTNTNLIFNSVNKALQEVSGKTPRFTEVTSDDTVVLKNKNGLKAFLLETVKLAKKEHGCNLPELKDFDTVDKNTKRSILEQYLIIYMEYGCSISESARQHLMFGPVEAHPFPRPIEIRSDVEHLPIHWNPMKPSKLVRELFNLDLRDKTSTKVDKRKSENAKKRGLALPIYSQLIAINCN